MLGKRGQGLPLETIVIVIITILVLIIVILFATGSLGRLLGGARMLEEEITPDQLATFRLGCENACFTAEQLTDSIDEFRASDYCHRNISNTVFCHSQQTGVDCSFQITQADGTRVDISNDDCT